MHGNYFETDRDYKLLPLRTNKNIIVENKPIFYREWFTKGIIFVNDIVNDDRRFLYTLELHNRFNIIVNIMEYNSVTSTLSRLSR